MYKKKVSRLLVFKTKSIYWNNVAANIQIIAIIPLLGTVIEGTTPPPLKKIFIYVLHKKSFMYRINIF